MNEQHERPHTPSERGAVSRAVGLASELGVAMGLMAAAMLLGVLLLGRWLDRTLGTNPWLTIVLLVAGATSSQVVLYRMATNSAAQLDRGAAHALNRVALGHSFRLAGGALFAAVVPALLGVGLGLLLDRALGTVILLTILLAVAGFAVGIVLLLRLVRLRRDAPQGAE